MHSPFYFLKYFSRNPNCITRSLYFGYGKVSGGVFMYRKITIFLEYWKNSKHRKPLILQGARQVGKTYSVLEFGRTHYENTVYFNFDTNPKLKQTFDEDISPEYLVPILSHISSQTIVRETTLIVFDENKKIVPLYAAFCI